MAARVGSPVAVVVKQAEKAATSHNTRCSRHKPGIQCTCSTKDCCWASTSFCKEVAKATAAVRAARAPRAAQVALLAAQG
eukprot:5769561-Prymnesium_polylepis.1